MSRQHTEELVRELARSLQPVRRLPRLRSVALAVAGVALASGATGLWMLGPRADVAAFSLAAPFASLAAGLALFACGGLCAALGAGVPGRRPLVLWGLALMAAGLLGWLGGGISLLAEAPVAAPGASWLRMTARCTGLALLIGLPATACLLPFLARTVPRRPALARASGAAAPVAVGALSVHLYCPGNEPLHVLLSHGVGPLALAALLGAALRSAGVRRAGP